MPRVGLSVDRRVMAHIGEVLHEDNVEVLMCVVCGCKELCHKGFDRLGVSIDKGNIAYRGSPFLGGLLTGDLGRQDIWKHNLSWAYFQERFGSAVSTDAGMEPGSFEWKRLNSKGAAMLCNPEDVVLSAVVSIPRALFVQCARSPCARAATLQR